MKTELQEEFEELKKRANCIENKINNICNNLASGDLEKLYQELEAVKCKLESTRFVGQRNSNSVDCECSIPRFISKHNL